MAQLRTRLIALPFVLLLLPGIAVYAAHTQTASGSWTDKQVLFLSQTSSGSNTVINSVVSGTISGTFSGTFISVGVTTIAPTGLATYQATDYCFCSVLGQAGLITFSEKGQVVPLSPTLGALTSVAAIVQSQTTIGGLKGQITLTGTADLTTFLTFGSYVGSISCPDRNTVTV